MSESFDLKKVANFVAEYLDSKFLTVPCKTESNEVWETHIACIALADVEALDWKTFARDYVAAACEELRQVIARDVPDNGFVCFKPLTPNETEAAGKCRRTHVLVFGQNSALNHSIDIGIAYCTNK